MNEPRLTMTSALANLDKARLALAESRTLSEIKSIRDIAEAARSYAKAAHLSKESLDYASEIKLLAERKAGELLQQLDRGKAGKPSKVKAARSAAISDYQKALHDTKTPDRTARYWQTVARIPEETTKAYIKETKSKASEPVSTSGLLRHHQKETRAAIPTVTPITTGHESTTSSYPTYLRIIPLTLARANALVSKLHRHHKKCVGHRFSIGVADENGILRGAAIVGRAVARKVDQDMVLEISRLVTDGSPNACSVLYGACARVAKEMGFLKIQTYILETESGTSLKASGWVNEGEAGGGPGGLSREGRRSDQPIVRKQRWVKLFEPTLIKVQQKRAA